MTICGMEPWGNWGMGYGDMVVLIHGGYGSLDYGVCGHGGYGLFGNTWSINNTLVIHSTR